MMDLKRPVDTYVKDVSLWGEIIMGTTLLPAVVEFM